MMHPPSPKHFPHLGLSALALCVAFGLGCDGAKKSKKIDEASAQAATEQAGSSAAALKSEAGSATDVFTTALAADPETFDPGKMSGAPEGRIAFNLFEGLLMPGPTTEGLDDPSEVVVPAVAKSFELSADGKTYTFKLRPDATWSDGSALTSEDFVYSWKRVLSPEFPAPYKQMMWGIQGAEAFSQNKGGWEAVGIKAPDPHTLEVTLRAPTPYFPELVAFYTFFPVPKGAIDQHAEDWTKPEHIVTNGAYTLKGYTPQQEVRLERRATYWDAKNVSLGAVRLRILSDLNAIVNAYKTGELHWSGQNLPVAQVSNLLMHPDYMQEPLLGTYFYRVNVSKKDSPLNDKRVREALSLGLDRDQLVKQTLKGLFTVATAYVPDSLPGYTSAASVEGNATKAKSLLSEAGYGPEKPLKIQVLYNTDENHKLVAESIQSMWKSLGVEVELVNKEWKTYLQDVDTLNYEVARAGWIGDYNDPMTFLDMWVSGNGNNDTGWSNKAYDNLIAQATAQTDVKARSGLDAAGREDLT